jgi:hypothetical protein
MSSTFPLFQDILHGPLNPIHQQSTNMDEDAVTPVRSRQFQTGQRSTPTEVMKYQGWLQDMLSAQPHQTKMWESEWHKLAKTTDYDRIDKVSSYLAPLIKAPRDRISNWYQRVMIAEYRRYLTQIVTDIDAASDSEIKEWRVVRTLRRLSDHVVSADNQIGTFMTGHISDLPNLGTIVMENTRIFSLALMQELVLRYEKEFDLHAFVLQEYYLHTLDRPAPVTPPFQYTKTYWEAKLRDLLSSVQAAQLEPLQDWIRDLLHYRSTQKQLEMEIRGGPSPSHALSSSSRKPLQNKLLPAPLTQMDMRTLIRKAEHMLFLCGYQASFIADHPEQLLDLPYTRDWLLAFKLPRVEEISDTEAVDELRNLLRASKWLDLLYRQTESGLRPPSLPQSEAWQLKQMLEAVMNGHSSFPSSASIPSNAIGIASTGNPYQTSGPSDNTAPQFAQFQGSFEDFMDTHFVDLNDLMDTLPVQSRTVKKYLSEADVDIVQYSDTLRYISRQQIDQFIKIYTGKLNP